VTDDPHGTANIPVGTRVVGYGGAALGAVREVHPHYILVGTEGQHEDLEVPVHAILDFDGKTLTVHVNRESTTAVDDVETAHRINEQP